MVSEINLTIIKPKNGLLAFANFILNDSYYVGDVALYSRLDGSGFRCVYPVRSLANGGRVSIFHPINKPAALAIEGPIYEYYEKLLEGKDGRAK